MTTTSTTPSLSTDDVITSTTDPAINSSTSGSPATDTVLSDSDHAHHVAFMQLALAEAEKALQIDEVPVGCVIVHQGRVIAGGGNRTNRTKNGTRHCEFVALDSIAANPDPAIRNVNLAECTLYVTVEPCIMCGAALRLVGIGSVVFGCGNDRFGGNGSTLPLHLCPSLTPFAVKEPDSGMTTVLASQTNSSSSGTESLPAIQGWSYPIIRGVMKQEAIDILKRFYARGNQHIPMEKRHRKVASTSPPTESATMTDG